MMFEVLSGVMCSPTTSAPSVARTARMIADLVANMVCDGELVWKSRSGLVMDRAQKCVSLYTCRGHPHFHPLVEGIVPLLHA